jgi:hypothetical protein
MYLPHQGVGGGFPLLPAIDEPFGDDGPTAAAADHHMPQLGRGEGAVGEAPQPIRGRVEYRLQPLGASCDNSEHGARIRGRASALGAPQRGGPRSAAAGNLGGHQPGDQRLNGGGGARLSRAEAILAVQHASIRRSLDDHADRVAKKARLGESPAPPSASARLAAVRARVAARANAAAAVQPHRHAAVAVDDAASHAATRDADHGVASPLAYAGR